MFDALGGLTEWLLHFVDSPWGVLALGLNAFTEAVFFPVPPDPLLLAMALADPSKALWLAGLTTIASASGAVLGHWLGRRFGRPVLRRLVRQDKVDAIERLFARHGVSAVLIAAFTPIPYKVFAIAAGVLNFRLRPFILASLVGRGMRFFLLGGLVFVFGDPIREFLSAHFELLTVVTAAAVGVVAAAWVVFRRIRPAGAAR